MMNISEAVAADPAAPETVAGGSYLPQTPPVNPQAAVKGIAKPYDLRGKVSDVNDLNLTLSGISNGDPVGMETFDLGFFEDGTPAIVINGANVPIQQSQWMALLTMRNKTREEIKSQMQFEAVKQQAKTTISAIIKSAPNIPPQLGMLLMSMADMDPGEAIKQTQQLLVSMSKDGGKQQIGQLSAMIQDNSISAEMSRLNREVEVEVGKSPLGEPIMAKSSAARLRMGQLSKSNEKSKQKTAYAVSVLDQFFPPKGLKANPATSGSIGIFDAMASTDGGDVSELSKFELLRSLAAYSDLWPSKVEWVNAPTGMGPNAGQPVDMDGAPQEYRQFRNYLLELDQWASNAFKWDRSDSRAIDLYMQQVFVNNSMGQIPQGAQPVQGAQPAATTGDSTGFNFDS
jgi:hypothetical protein